MPAFARSVAPFLRTAQSALRQGNSASPLQHAWQRQNGVAVLNAVRTYAAVFERTKPHVNIGMQSMEQRYELLLTVTGTIGHVDHGKVVQSLWNVTIIH